MSIFFLDDDPKRHNIFSRHTIGHKVVTAKSVEELTEKAGSGFAVDCASFDHDLIGTYQPCGLMCGCEALAYFLELCRFNRAYPLKIILHTFNQDMLPKMVKSILNHGGMGVSFTGQIVVAKFNTPAYWEALGINHVVPL